MIVEKGNLFIVDLFIQLIKLCLKCVPEVADGNNLTNRPLVGKIKR